MGDFEGDMTMMLGQIWREKRLSMDEAALHLMIEMGLESAKRYKITSKRGAAAYIGLMFMLGSSFNTDPQYPRASSILNNPSLGDEAARVKKLHEEAIAYLERLLSAGEREKS
jgi:hypothetical protein